MKADLGLRVSDSGLFLHASSVIIHGGAVLFLGHSTSGKSTIARRLGEIYPILADDSVFAARGADGGWRVVDGGFRFGEGDFVSWKQRIHRQIAENSVPLRACLRIHKASAVRMESMEPVELARHLMDAAMEIDLQRKWGKKSGVSNMEPSAWEEVLRARRQWFSQVADIARTALGGHFWFSRESDVHEMSAILEKGPQKSAEMVKILKNDQK